MTDETLPFRDGLCVQVADSGYSGRTYLGAVVSHRNLVTIVRLPSNRMVYRQFQRPPEEKALARHPT